MSVDWPLVNGTFGTEAERATRRFQMRGHLAVDGVVGPHTWQLLIVEAGSG
jgi:zinc D-Ala-D-Ala carboxypeptidase